jgi:hypothetical protein
LVLFLSLRIDIDIGQTEFLFMVLYTFIQSSLA